ncbi:MAG: hypothetical protein DI538_09370 [Azospira oryzae]|nr:MAG: hypothetical protein DI538_09370 [Azospira oryzae]
MVNAIQKYVPLTRESHFRSKRRFLAQKEAKPKQEIMVVKLPNNLKSSKGEVMDVRDGMIANTEIITEDLTLTERDISEYY